MIRCSTSLILLSFILKACVPHAGQAPPALMPGPAESPAPVAHSTKTPEDPLPPPPIPAPEEPRHPLKAKSFSTRGIEFSVVTFDRRNHDLVVVDQTGGPGSKYQRAEDAGRGHLAAINAGFFTPEGNPLGLVITQGQTRGNLNRSSFLGTGLFIGPKASLISRSQFLDAPSNPPELLQSGPRLLWSGETLSGLSSKDQRPRSFLLWDGRNHFALGYANPVSLKGLSTVLASQPIPDFKITHALNLDGGRSSDLWVSPSVSGGGFSRRSFLNKDVRNFLVLKNLK